MAADPGRPRAGRYRTSRTRSLANRSRRRPRPRPAGGRPGPLGPGGRDLDRQVEEAGHDLQVEGGPDHHRRPQQGLDLGAGPPGPGQHRVPQRRRDAGLVLAALGRRPQASTVNRVWPLARSSTGPARPATPKRRASSATASAGSGPSSRTRPASARAASASAPSSARTRGRHQHTVAGQAAQQEMEQLQGGGARQVEVVDGQQQRLLVGQAAHEAGDGLERPPPLQLRRRPLVAGQVEQLPEVRHQLGQGPGGVPGRRRHPPRRQRQRRRPHRLRHRLQEQRPLRLVAPRLHHQPPGRPGQLRHRLHQPGLPDPRLPHHQHHPRPPPHRPLPGRRQLGHLPLPPHKPGVGGAQPAARGRGPAARPGPARQRRAPPSQRTGAAPAVAGGGRPPLRSAFRPGAPRRIGEVEGLGLGGGVGAELGGQGLAEVLVGGQGGGGLAGGGVGEHDGAPGGLVQGVGGGGGAGVGQGAGGGRRRPGRRPRRAAGPGRSGCSASRRAAWPSRRRARRPGTGPARAGPGRARRRPGPGRARRPGGPRPRRPAVPPRPGRPRPGARPRTASPGGRRRSPPARARPAAGSPAWPGWRRGRRAAARPTGPRPATSAGTTAPRRASSSFSRVRPLRLASSWAGTSRPSTATASTPSTCTRRLACWPIRRLWSIRRPLARAATAAGPARPVQAPAADRSVANRAAHCFQVPASSGTREQPGRGGVVVVVDARDLGDGEAVAGAVDDLDRVAGGDLALGQDAEVGARAGRRPRTGARTPGRPCGSRA